MKKKATKKPKLPSMKMLRKELDETFNLYVRRLWKFNGRRKCNFCPRKGEHCFHYVTARQPNTRWVLENVTVSCRGCNFLNEFNPHKFILKFIDQKGVHEYFKLVEDSAVKVKHTRKDLMKILKHYQDGLKTIS